MNGLRRNGSWNEGKMENGMGMPGNQGGSEKNARNRGGNGGGNEGNQGGNVRIPVGMCRLQEIKT